MIKALVFDLCRVFLFPKRKDYFGELNQLHEVLSKELSYDFNDYFEFNQELLDFLKTKELDIKYPMYIFTSGKIQETIECQRFVSGYFRKTFSASELKLPKKKTSSYLVLADKLNLQPHEILFIDDNRGNTVAAEAAGVCTITFRNNMQFETEIEGYLAGNKAES